jgi:hypothetical protein
VPKSAAVEFETRRVPVTDLFGAPGGDPVGAPVGDPGGDPVGAPVGDPVDSADSEVGGDGGLDIARISGRGGRVIPGSDCLHNSAVLDVARSHDRRLAHAEVDGDRPGAWVAVYPGGYKAKRTRSGGMRGGGGQRGPITRFSAAARRRMRERLLQFDFRDAISEGRVLWVTFTARVALPGVAKEWLSNWRRRWMRRNPRAWYIWHIEPQDRGAAHFHLICVFPTAAAAVFDRDLMIKDWCEVTGRLSVWDGQTGDYPNAMPQGQHIRPVKGLWGLASYISDASKLGQRDFPSRVFLVDSEGNCEISTPGRWWGVRTAYIGDDRRPVYSDMLAWPVMIYDWQAYFDALRYAGKLRRSRYRQFRRTWRGPPGAVRDSVTFCNTEQFFKLDRVFRGNPVGDTRPGPDWWRK